MIEIPNLEEYTLDYIKRHTFFKPILIAKLYLSEKGITHNSYVDCETYNKQVESLTKKVAFKVKKLKEKYNIIKFNSITYQFIP